MAVGTSLLKLATSVIAGARGNRDLAVGNLIGSSIFKILGVMGVACVACAQRVAVSPVALQLDLPVMLAVAAVCLPIFLYRHAVVRQEGLLLIGYYALQDPMESTLSAIAIYLFCPVAGRSRSCSSSARYAAGRRDSLTAGRGASGTPA